MSGFRLVDFGSASNNDRLYDLAIRSGAMIVPDDVDRTLIETYVDRHGDQLFARPTVHEALADVTWSISAMVQNRFPHIGVDV